MKVIRLIFIMLFVIVFVSITEAQTFSIVKMSYPKTIRIGGLQKTEHNTFDGKSVIEWSNGRQWFYAKRNGIEYKVTSRGFKKYQVNSMNLYLSKYLGHKGTGDVHYSEKEYYLLGSADTLLFETKGRLNPGVKVIAKWDGGKQTYEIPLEKTIDNLHYLVTTNIYKDISPRPEHIKLSIREEEEGWVDNVYTNINIIYLPDK